MMVRKEKREKRIVEEKPIKIPVRGRAGSSWDACKVPSINVFQKKSESKKENKYS